MSFTLTNVSTEPLDTTEIITIDLISHTPACGQVALHCPTGFTDPGVFEVIGPATGSQACAGKVFNVVVADATTGEVNFVPQDASPVVLGPASGPDVDARTCTISFAVKVLALPSNGVPVGPGVLTNQLVKVLARPSSWFLPAIFALGFSEATVEESSAITCGDGVITGSEQCDDGPANGTTVSCCGVDCTVNSNGTLCTDGNVCTQSDTCQNGACIGGSRVNWAASVGELWPPAHELVEVSVMGVTNHGGAPLTTTIVGIAQDEPTSGLGDGDQCPDGAGIGTSTAKLRAERAGTGDGRVYHVSFLAENDQGEKCPGTVQVCVPHDRGRGRVCGNQGPLEDSTGHCP